MDDSLTWEQMKSIEPGLARLEEAVLAIRDDGSTRSYCANAVWYGWNDGPSYKDCMNALVGWHRDRNTHPFMLTSDAWAIAHDALYGKALSVSCRGCWCA